MMIHWSKIICNFLETFKRVIKYLIQLFFSFFTVKIFIPPAIKTQHKPKNFAEQLLAITQEIIEEK